MSVSRGGTITVPKMRFVGTPLDLTTARAIRGLGEMGLLVKPKFVEIKSAASANRAKVARKIARVAGLLLGVGPVVE